MSWSMEYGAWSYIRTMFFCVACLFLFVIMIGVFFLSLIVFLLPISTSLSLETHYSVFNIYIHTMHHYYYYYYNICFFLVLSLHDVVIAWKLCGISPRFSSSSLFSRWRWRVTLNHIDIKSNWVNSMSIVFIFY